MTIEEQFLPYDLSEKLARLGFNYPCLARYKESYELSLLSKPSINIETFPICAPLWQQAFEWLSENHKIDILIHKYKTDSYFISINGNYLVDDLDFKLLFKKDEVKTSALEKAFKIIKSKIN